MGGTSPSPGPGLAALRARLHRAEDFDAAAVATLSHLLEVAQAAVESSRFPEALVQRAMLHLRPKDGYAGLYVLERGAESLSAPGASQALLPSATVWRFIESQGEPVAVDVELGLIEAPSSTPTTVAFGPVDPDEDLSEHSRLRLLSRGATHLYVLPLRLPGRLAGMISIEVQCPSAMGQTFVWESCRADFEDAVGFAAPYVVGLPARPGAAPSLEEDPLLPVVGPSMTPLVQVFRAFASEEETLLIRGETGSGKSRLARWCHAQSPRKSGPFEVLDLQTVPEETQTGELFGWRKGAFTGAVADHDGYVSRAEGGTLFIDEIDKLSMRAQASLLALLEERRYRILGDAGPPRRARVRFMIGTNADLRALVEEGRFREDLYYRINVLPLALPPLRERKDEIADWAVYMLERRHTERAGSGRAQLADDAKLHLLRSSWPGNLRELDNIMRRAYTLASLTAEGPGLVVQLRHVEQAEAMEGGAHRGSLRTPLSSLREAAQQLVLALMAIEDKDAVGEVDMSGALHGVLLAEAVRLSGDREAAFRLLGRAELVKNRNHHKALRRDWARAQALYALLEELPPEALAEALDG